MGENVKALKNAAKKVEQEEHNSSFMPVEILEAPQPEPQGIVDGTEVEGAFYCKSIVLRETSLSSACASKVFTCVIGSLISISEVLVVAHLPIDLPLDHLPIA